MNGLKERKVMSPCGWAQVTFPVVTEARNTTAWMQSYCDLDVTTLKPVKSESGVNETNDHCKGPIKTSTSETGVDGEVPGVMNINSQPISSSLFNEPFLGHKNTDNCVVSTYPAPHSNQSELQENNISRIVLETSAEDIEGPITFNEVAVYFSEEEWQRLGQLEKGLYKEVIMDNYHMLKSLGLVGQKPEIVQRIERGEDVTLSHQQELLWRTSCLLSNPGCASINQMDPKYSPIQTSYWTCHDNVLSQTPEERYLMERNSLPLHVTKMLYLRQEFHQDVEKSCTPDPSNKSIIDNQSKKDVYMETDGHKGVRQDSHLKSLHQIHTGEKLHACSECGVNFADSGSLIKHHRTHSIEKQFECPKCSRKFSQKFHLDMHQKSHMKQPCSECGHLITNSTNLQPKQKDCLKCNQRLKERLNSQRPPKKREKIYPCPQCEKFFTRRSNLVVHCRTHTGEKPYTCPDCGKTFTDRSNLVSHLRTHTGEKPYTCSECGKSFPYCSALVIHKRTHTGEKPFVCNECGKSFVCNSHLVLHMKAHTGDRPFGCEVCGKSFPCSSTLVKHQIIHTGERPYICMECGKTFVRGSHLAIHQRTHTGEKPFICPDCGKGFTDKSNLKSHQRTHKTEKDYECKECGRRFTQSSTLLKHQRIHTKEKPFACPECGKFFSRKCNLMIHLRMHTGEKPYPCTVCNKRFSIRPHLVKHQKVHK